MKNLIEVKNLIQDRWIPVRRMNRKEKEFIAPYEITDGVNADPFIELTAPRADFNGALIQFLIGLLQTTCAPENGIEWRNWFRKAPEPEELRERFSIVSHAFDLYDCEYPFLQEKFDGKVKDKKGKKRELDIHGILLDGPGENTTKENRDLFIKRATIQKLCPACTAAALFTLQTNAPGGGQGHLTGLRGGGPSTTVVIGDTLWKTCWLNVLERSAFIGLANGNKMGDNLRFPWMPGAGRHNNKGGEQTKVTSWDVHPDQIYWSMPRRILLNDPIAALENDECDLCGEKSRLMFTHYQTLPHGIKYDGPWAHPLSPYTSKTGKKVISSIKFKPGGVGYRHWSGLVLQAETGQTIKKPAKVVETYLRDRSWDNDMRLWFFGYCMKKHTPCAWYEGIMPVIVAPEEIREDFYGNVKNMIGAANFVSRFLLMACLKALYFRPKSSKGGKTEWDFPKRLKEIGKKGALSIDTKLDKDSKSLLDSIRQQFWQGTEPVFLDKAGNLREILKDRGDANLVLESWIISLRSVALKIFDQSTSNGAFDIHDARRVALARHELSGILKYDRLKDMLDLTGDDGEDMDEDKENENEEEE